MSPLQRRLAEWVDEGLNRTGWKQVQLASKAAMSEKHLSTILNGRAAGSLETWDRLLALVGVRDEALAPGGGSR